MRTPARESFNAIVIHYADILLEAVSEIAATRTELLVPQKSRVVCAFIRILVQTAIESIKPTTIIGVSTIGGAFTQKVIETVSRITERPVILALSNPTDHAECTAEQAYTWSNGKAIYAAGVQFPPVHLKGQTFLPGQANNFYIFPAIGMAVFATQASRVTDEMFIEAAKGVADQVPSELLNQGLIYPLQSNILETEIQTAARVAKLVFDSGLARVEKPKNINAWLRSLVYKPEYATYAEAETRGRYAAD